MTVFKAFIKIFNKNKSIIIMYSVILILFSVFNMQTSDHSMSFSAEKPNVLIINQDDNIGITKDLISYLEKNSKKVKVEKDEDKINDALFYRDVNYVIYIPSGYRKDFLNHKNPKISVKSTKDYYASLAEMLLQRYLKVADTYLATIDDEESIIRYIHDTLNKNVKVEVTSKLDTGHLQKAKLYYNFMNYSVLAGSVYIICLILYSFNEEKIRKRTSISSMSSKRFNQSLLLSNGLFAILLWGFYILLSFLLLGSIMMSVHGGLLILNSFVFAFCALALSFLIGNLVHNKNAINGIVNVLALGSSFLCGAFVPIEWLPKLVLNIAHFLPSYYYIMNNELIVTTEDFSTGMLQPILINFGIILLFSILFIMISYFVSKTHNKKD